MPTITNRSTLHSEIDSWSERSYTEGQKDGFVQIVENWANRRLGPDYRRVTSATVNTDTSGEGALPSGFVTMRSFTRAVSGSVPLKQTSWAALIDMNPYAFTDDATHFAIRGTTLKVAPIVDDDFTAVYEATLSGLTSSNATNWLVTDCPNFYLFGCLSAAEAFNQNLAQAIAWKAQAMEELDALVGQGDVAQFGSADLYLDFVTP